MSFWEVRFMFALIPYFCLWVSVVWHSCSMCVIVNGWLLQWVQVGGAVFSILCSCVSLVWFVIIPSFLLFQLLSLLLYFIFLFIVLYFIIFIRFIVRIQLLARVSSDVYRDFFLSTLRLSSGQAKEHKSNYSRWTFSRKDDVHTFWSNCEWDDTCAINFRVQNVIASDLTLRF